MLSINSYNPVNLSLYTGVFTGIDFGSFAAGNHSKNVRVVKPVVSGGTISQISLYLENKGGLNNSNFGRFKSSDNILNIQAGSDYLSGHFTEVPGVSTFLSGGLALTPSNLEKVWLDIETGSTDIRSGNVNYRFVYNFT
jgi:hypothetical protein